MQKNNSEYHSFVTSPQASFTPTDPSKTTDSSIKSVFTTTSSASYVYSPTTPEKISTLINVLDLETSCGSDDIVLHALKLSKSLLTAFLSDVTNECTCVRVFPKNTADVVPNFKSSGYC